MSVVYFFGSATPSKVFAEPALNASLIETQKTYSRKEAYRASENQIVLHYGKGVNRVEHIKAILNGKGYPAVTYEGGAKGQVELFIHRGIIGKYDQGGVDNGELGSDAMTFYNKRVRIVH